MPKMVTVKLISTAPYSQSAMHEAPKLNKETPGDFDERTWREKCTVDENGVICIPAMAFKQALDDVAKMFSTQIPGKGKSTYTKHFKAGVFCTGNVSIGVRKEDVGRVKINANADGVRGSGKRVPRIFPVVPKWEGEAEFIVADDTITKEVFEKHITDAGLFIGVGRFRPQNGGMNGRFKAVSFNWADVV